jgi:hypothetical protein
MLVIFSKNNILYLFKREGRKKEKEISQELIIELFNLHFPITVGSLALA